MSGKETRSLGSTPGSRVKIRVNEIPFPVNGECYIIDFESLLEEILLIECLHLEQRVHGGVPAD